MKAKEGETVVFSFIIFKPRIHRDQVNAKVMQDQMMNDPKYKDKPVPSDMKRMAYGGFRVIVEAKGDVSTKKAMPPALSRAEG